jgi:phosphatidylglycerophosphate synthase
MRRRLADAVSLSRLVLLAPWVWLQAAGSRWALLIMAAIVLTDLIDGPIARRFSTAGLRGQLLDAACDAVVLIVAAAVVGLKDARFLGLAGLMIACFASWGAYSAIAGRLAYTRLGRYNGAACYVLIVMASSAPWVSAFAIQVPAVMEWAAIAVPVSLLGVSTAENVVGMVRACRVQAPAMALNRSEETDDDDTPSTTD